MKVFEGNTIKEVYSELIETLKTSDMINGTREINNCCLIVNNPTTKNINFYKRKISEDYALAELKWYWSGDNSCETIGKHAKMWLRLSDDGKTNNSAYGYILEKKYGYDQIQQIIQILISDSSSRRAILNISDPALNKQTTKDLQCTIGIHFLIRNGQLEETVYMRSNDVYFGLPYDYIYFISLGEYIAKKVGVPLGKYIHNATSMHMYLKDVEKFKDEDQIINIDIDKIIKENYER